MEKLCSRCKKSKSIKDFSENRGYKDKRDPWCKDCRKEYNSDYRHGKIEQNIAKYLLKRSCQKMFERGQPNYTKPPYQNVRCKWESWNSALQYFLVNDGWMKDWVVQTEIYVENGMELEYRPTIDRIDSSGHYEPSNVRVAPFGPNCAGGGSKGKECEVLFLKNGQVCKFAMFDTITATAKELGITIKALNVHALNLGKFYNIGNGYIILAQKKGELLNISKKPKYMMVVDQRTEKRDLDTGEVVEVLDRLQYKVPVSGIGFNLSQRIG